MKVNAFVVILKLLATLVLSKFVIVSVFLAVKELVKFSEMETKQNKNYPNLTTYQLAYVCLSHIYL